MKIVHVTEAFEGGVIEFLRSLTNSTPDLEYTIVYGRTKNFEPARKTFPAAVKFIPWPSVQREIRPGKDLKSLRELVKILKEEKPFDIIHLHSAKAGILGRLAARMVGCKRVIFAPHGATFLRQDVSKLTKRLYITIEKAVNIIPAHTVGVSKSEADSYKGIGIKAKYVNNGKDFPVKERAERANGVFTIVTTGRIATQKNPALFNEIATAFTNNDKVRFIWVGDGVQKDMLTSKNIHVTGWIHHTEVAGWLEQSNLYISTALWEGLPYAVLEAMSMHLPLLLSNCPGNNDLVQDDINGFLFSEATQAVKHIKQYMKDAEKVYDHGDASFNMLQSDFSVHQMQQGYRNLYSVIKRKKY